MTDHIVKDHDLQYYIITEDHMKDHSGGQHVINDQQTMLVGQQQLGNPRSQHKDITWQQQFENLEHMNVDIERLINDWLNELV